MVGAALRDLSSPEGPGREGSADVCVLLLLRSIVDTPGARPCEAKDASSLAADLQDHDPRVIGEARLSRRPRTPAGRLPRDPRGHRDDVCGDAVGGPFGPCGPEQVGPDAVLAPHR